MRFGRRALEESQEIQMAPLIDIVFITLVFFMTTSVFATLESEIDITLPTADAAKQGERTAGEIYINLRDDGKIILNNRERTIAELQEVLNRLAEHFPGGAVIIRGDRNAVLGRAIDVLNCCKKADIQNVCFAALREDAQEGR